MYKFFLIILMGFSTVQLSASASECLNWQAQHPEWLWCDDFEGSSNLASRYQDVSTQGMQQSTEDAYAGTQSLQQIYTAGQVDAGWVAKVSNYPDHIFYRFYHKFGSGYNNVFPPKVSRVGYRNFNTWTEVFRVHTWLDETTGEITLDTLARNSTQGPWLPLATSNYSLADHLNEWVALEVEIKLNTQGAADGLYRLWANDQLLIERLNVDLRGNTSDTINEVFLDCYWNGGASADNLKRYFDNFVISTQKIGLLGTSPPSPPLAPSDFTATAL